MSQLTCDIVRIRFTAIELSNSSGSDKRATSRDSVKVYVPTLKSIDDNAGAASTFQLFPNPTAGGFTIRAKGFKGKWINLSLIHLQGRIVEERMIRNNTNNIINERFNLSGRSNGVYFVAIRSESGTEVKKLILTR